MIGLFQPEIGRRLSGHPITDKLVMAVNFAYQDPPSATGSAVALIPEDTGIAGPGSYLQAAVGYAIGTNRYGQWAGFDVVALNSHLDWTRSDFIPTSGCTVMLLYEKADATLRSSYAFTVNLADGSGGNAARCSSHLPFTDGKVYWDFGGVVEGTTRLSTAVTMSADRWVFSTGSRGMEIWQNGIKRASNAANPTRTAAVTSPFVLGAKTTNSVFSDQAHYNLFAMWARQLTQDEILMVSTDPYMLWESPSAPWSLSAVTGEGEAEAPSEHPYAGGLTIYKVTPERWG